MPGGLLRRVALVLAVLLVAAGAWNYFRPIPAGAATSASHAQSAIAGTPPGLPWPGVGSAAVGVSELGLIAASSDVPPVPAASVAKVMTALVLLADKPLATGEAGPSLTITAQDVATYKADAAEGQSVVPVTAGEQLTEYEVLEALLIPSGNNIAETLARWDAGSVAAFVDKMNQRAVALRLAHTMFADPAGVSLQTVSTPTDLLALGMAAMRQEVLVQIVNLPQTVLPVAGTVYNVNAALGQSGIIGIKTGSGLNFGANFLFAAAATVAGHQLTLYGCVMGQPTLDAAFNEAKKLIGAMQAALSVRQVIARKAVVGAYETAWGSRSDLLATVDVTLVEWPGMILRERLNAPTLPTDESVARGTPAGNLHIILGDQQVDVPLVTASSLDPPGIVWRLSRINLS
ncbi:MAG: D-alanyl-D-alanine carboxypeptidase [Chloroflexi bacterium]|nr:MAG: D-alanyl-D-alanine carboxypeptidase [Chloroflexota bacterium]